jgi:hypothetical protein
MSGARKALKKCTDFRNCGTDCRAPEDGSGANVGSSPQNRNQEIVECTVMCLSDEKRAMLAGELGEISGIKRLLPY